MLLTATVTLLAASLAADGVMPQWSVVWGFESHGGRDEACKPKAWTIACSADARVAVYLRGTCDSKTEAARIPGGLVYLDLKRNQELASIDPKDPNAPMHGFAVSDDGSLVAGFIKDPESFDRDPANALFLWKPLESPMSFSMQELSFRSCLADGSGFVFQPFPVSPPSFSPDGRRLAFFTKGLALKNDHAIGDWRPFVLVLDLESKKIVWTAVPTVVPEETSIYWRLQWDRTARSLYLLLHGSFQRELEVHYPAGGISAYQQVPRFTLYEWLLGPDSPIRLAELPEGVLGVSGEGNVLVKVDDRDEATKARGSTDWAATSYQTLPTGALPRVRDQKGTAEAALLPGGNQTAVIRKGVVDDPRIERLFPGTKRTLVLVFYRQEGASGYALLERPNQNQ